MLTLYHAPQSRAFGVLWLLEEMQVDYALESIDLGAQAPRPPGYREIQPHGKVPAIVHDGAIVSERAAICHYLGEAFPEAGLLPPPGDPGRTACVQMLVYADAVVDPCLASRAAGWSYPAADFSFGSFADMLAHLRRVLTERAFAAGDRFTVADTQLATALYWGIEILGLVENEPVLDDYVGRMRRRAGWRRAESRDSGAAAPRGAALDLNRT